MDSEERAKLVKKLDDDLEDFISGLKPKKYEDGWPEDRWEEEMEKHPMFMTKPIEEGQELPPLVEAMQQLKYDSSVNSPLELATSYKEDGNVNFKRKKYRWAVDSYTQGLEAKCDVKELNAQLYTNRAAAHFYIGNFQKALKDATEAKSLKPDYIKAIHRGALCLLELGSFEDCISWCNEGLKIDETNVKLCDLKSNAVEKKTVADRDKRKAAANEAKQKKESQKLWKIINERGINMAGGKCSDIRNLEAIGPAITHTAVHLDNEGKLIWPVMLLYPEYGVTDCIQNFHEDSCFLDQLDVMFDPEDPPSWDKEHTYKIQDLQIYFPVGEESIVPVSKETPLKSILCDKRYKVHSGTPCFIVTVRHSEFDKAFRLKSNVSS